MEDQSVGMVLLGDLKANLVWFQLGGFFITSILALVSATLAARGYAALSEARLLFWQAGEAERAVLKAQHSGRRAHSDTINAASRGKRLYRGRRRGLL